MFLSIRGEDTCKTFTDHLYTAFVNAGLCTFRDDPELEKGESVKENLEKAVQQSRSSVIVLSKDYASSRQESKFIQSTVKSDSRQARLFALERRQGARGSNLINNPTVKAWLSDLKESVYDTDDLLREINTEMSRQKMEPELESCSSKVQELIYTPPSHAFDSALMNSSVEEVFNKLDFITKQLLNV
ncbi:uncharacterized protein LOC112166843 [Rosa chinensis]|uniref:uncharacterized protein LOC112166843 n=1 Tax=Rosa chinensis TaxID=74649 RepID=UPI000D08CF60|nr:uncharacterized protein LOC112166843 [Rosa chinensis]